MTYNWIYLLLLLSLVSIGMPLPTSLIEDVKKADQAMKPKSKRAQETLMFGNQQNRQANNADNTFISNAEKRTLSSSGLGGLKTALTEDNKSSHPKSPSNPVYNHETYSPFDKNYDYGKILVNEIDDDRTDMWDMPPYSRYYRGENRRKRSDKSTTTTSRSTTLHPLPTSSFQVPTPTQQSVQAQVKRSVPFYQEPRYKRELPLEIDPEDVLTLLSLWENERRNGNWHKYVNEEYENMVDDSGLLNEEDARNVIPWMDASLYPLRHYSGDTLSPSDIGIVRTHPPNYYEQYGNQLNPHYEGTAQYGNSQYDFVYPQRYYPQEKRFMVAKKRAQSYNPYSAAQLQLSSQPRNYQYPHRMIY